MGVEKVNVELDEYELNLIKGVVRIAYEIYKFNNGPHSYSTLYTDLLDKVERANAEIESRLAKREAGAGHDDPV